MIAKRTSFSGHEASCEEEPGREENGMSNPPEAGTALGCPASPVGDFLGWHLARAVLRRCEDLQAVARSRDGA
ncbi:hypothetical protein MAE02_09460 [Microvirga aerophila]|uniref:Uncharacterized protein n=1 Tax=Microvirga aerophila TaxID=670291 RepID=A0A512BMR2_9HYPH|nr:hypothetical protein MAE02_09460 [Microvirga aerophila]